MYNNTAGAICLISLHNSAMLKKGERIKKARTSSNLSQKDLADACGLKSRNAVSLWESDDEHGTSPTLDNYRTISKVTGYNLLWLLDGTLPERSEGAPTAESIELDDEELFAAVLRAVDAASKTSAKPVSYEQKTKVIVRLYKEFKGEKIDDGFDRVINRFALLFLKEAK